jgi:hypothetical protein
MSGVTSTVAVAVSSEMKMAAGAQRGSGAAAA